MLPKVAIGVGVGSVGGSELGAEMVAGLALAVAVLSTGPTDSCVVEGTKGLDVFVTDGIVEAGAAGVAGWDGDGVWCATIVLVVVR